MKYLSIIIAFIAFECIWTRHIQIYSDICCKTGTWIATKLHFLHGSGSFSQGNISKYTKMSWQKIATTFSVFLHIIKTKAWNETGVKHTMYHLYSRHYDKINWKNGPKMTHLCSYKHTQFFAQSHVVQWNQNTPPYFWLAIALANQALCGCDIFKGKV